MVFGSAVTVGTLVAALKLDKSEFDRDIQSAGGGFSGFSQAVTKAALGVGLAFAGVGLAALGMAADEETGIARMNAALQANVENWDGNTEAIERAIDEREKLAFSDDELRDSMTRLVAITKDEQEALDLQATAMDLARLRGIDLSTASDLIGKVYGGNIGILSRYGIVLEEGATSTEALAAIQEMAAGQAQAFADTSAGAWQTVQNEFANVMESIGEKLLPMLSSLLGWVLDSMPMIQATMEGAFQAVGAAIAWITENVIPPLLDAFNGLVTFLDPIIALVEEHLQPILIAFGGVILAIVVPALLSMAAAALAAFAPFIAAGALIAGVVIVLEELGLMGPIIDFAMGLIRTAIDALSGAFQFITEKVLPPVIDVLMFLWEDVLQPLWSKVLEPLAKFIAGAFAAAFDLITKKVLPPLVSVFEFLWKDVLSPLWERVLKPLAEFVVGVMKKAFDLLRPAIDFVSDAFDALADVAKWVWDHVLKPVADFVAKALSDAFTGWQRIIEVVGDVFGDVMDEINRAITWVGDRIEDVIDGITGFFNDMIRSAQDLANKVATFLGDMFDPLVDGINRAVGIAKDIWNGFVRFWNGFEIRIPAIKIGDFQVTPELVFGLPDLPRLARGGTAMRDMFALVGEEGPEVVALPRGAHVYPHAESAGMMRSMGGNTFNVYGLTPDEVEQQVIRAQRRLALEWAL